ncbi:MAG: DUF721 domain-containing protein [Chlamydiia bacterium]
MGNCHYSKESAFEAEIAVIFLVAVLVTIDYNCNLSMSHRIKRIPFGYDGPLPTGRTLQRLLPKIMAGIEETQEQHPNVVLEAFQQILGNELSKIATAKSFVDGVLFVVVKNSTFLSVLHMQEKGRILAQLREKCPRHRFNNIVFRVG